ARSLSATITLDPQRKPNLATTSITTANALKRTWPALTSRPVQHTTSIHGHPATPSRCQGTDLRERRESHREYPATSGRRPPSVASGCTSAIKKQNGPGQRLRWSGPVLLGVAGPGFEPG
ncbi:MAG: hypothetical protein J2P17_34010, partial [Mycobacterium sp.]|nr:hypothetical protein [Mycobacterium sp.]